MRLVTLLLLLSVFVTSLVSGCGRKKDEAKTLPAPEPNAPPVVAPVDPNKDKHIDFRPTGGSTTVLGKARDRALDARILNEMRQVKTGLEADMAGVPANKAAWVAFLRDYPTLRGMVDRGELIAFSQVQLGDSSTVLMYETRILTANDGYVLMADGQPYRVDKARFDTLKKPLN
ncbi:MAG: hypothetical protein SNJ75_20060 [Gemmataceae bacterium]